jgi:DNA uptake protein ComE-like DNA-binding protein
MKPSIFSSYFQFSKSQRKGIFIFLSCAVVFQVLYFWIDFKPETKIKSVQEKQWLSTISKSDPNVAYSKKKQYVMKPFNPNFISDYKGYKLGMSVQEIDRLLEFRKQNKFVNSPEEFQKVTGISDSLLKTIVSYFKFPDWVINKGKASSGKFHKFLPREKEKIIQKDINIATREDLIAVYGIGEKLADKILLEKEKLGSFVSMEQFQFIWGISPEALTDLEKRFVVKSQNGIKKIAINDLSQKELAKFPYFNYALAKEIVIYRTMNNGIKEIADLTKIKGMPNEKINIIALYLDF